MPAKPTPRRPTSATPRTAIAPAESDYATAPFDLSLEKIPFAFKGHSLGALYSELSALEISKGEFETTAEFHAREARLPKPQAGRLYAFLRENINSIPTQYDAETGQLDASLVEDIGAYRDLDAVFNARAITFLDYSHTDSYVGTNAFAASVTVTRLTAARFAISVQNRSPGDTTIDRTRHIKLALPPEDAKVLKGQVGALYVCEVFGEPPYTFTGSKVSSRATVSAPYEERIDYCYVRVNLVAVWLYDRASGRVLQKVSPF